MYGEPVLLAPAHVVAGFDCGSEALNTWLVRRGLANHQTGTSRTWVVTEVNSPQVVAFYSSATASILRSDVPKKLTRNQPEEIPAILLGRLAVDGKHQQRGLASALLKHFIIKAIEVSERVGMRLLLVHAKDEDAKRFYEQFEFQSSPFDELTLLLPLQDIVGFWQAF